MLKVRALFGIRTPRKSSQSSQLWRGRHFLVLHLTLFFLTLSLSTALPDSIAGLAGHWSFDEGAGVIANDYSGNNNTGVLVNEPQWTTGRFGSGLSFDGVDDYVEIVHTDSLNLTRELTVSAWVYNQAAHEPFLQESEYHIIAAKGWAPDPGGSWTLAWDRKTNVLFFCARKNTDNGVKCASFDFGSLTNEWHLITALFNNGKIQLYVDGILAADPVSLGTAKINNNSENVYIGGLPSAGGNSNDSWHGFIDDVQISNVALNQTEIATMSADLRVQQNFDFSVASSGDLSAAQGSAAATNINTTLLSGTPKFVSFRVSGLPRNVNATFSVTSCSPSCTTNLTIKTASDSPSGSYPLTITAKAGSLQRRTSLNLVIVPTASLDFALSNAGDKSVAAGSSVINNIAATLVAGTPQTISLSTSGLPSGTSASFSNASCNPSCSSDLSLSTSSSTPKGIYPITVKGTGAGVSKTTTFNLSVDLSGVATPTITPNGGSYTGSVSVSLQTATSGASIYYTTDGSTPSQSSTLYTGAMTLTNSAVVKAKAFMSGYNSSGEASASFTVNQAFDFSLSNSGDKSVTAGSSVTNAISATLVSGSTQPVTFSASGLPSGATASFSPNSCSPSCSSTLTIATSGSTPGGTSTITVTALGGGVSKTTTFSLSVSLPTVATPTVSPNGGTYTGSVSVTLQTAISGASIYYTTNGSTPTQSSTLYAGAMTLTNSAVVKAKAFMSGYNPSAEASASFTVNQPPPFDFSLSNSGNQSVTAGSSVNNSISATLVSGSTQPVSFSASGLPSGATASFSPNSCSPSCSSTLTIATSGSTPGGGSTITVTASGGGVSKTTTFSLSVSLPTVATPTVSPNGGTYTGSVSVTLQTATSGVSIYYTTNGSTPTQSSTLYTGAMTLTNSAVVKAKAFKSGYNASSEASATFTITPQPSQLNLTWQDNSPNENGFQIERKIGTGGAYAQIASVGVNINSYLNTGLVSGTTYCYRVRAVNGAEISGYTNEACATAP